MHLTYLSIILILVLLPTLAAYAEPAAKPAVLFTGAYGGGCGFQVAGKLATAGFNLNGAQLGSLTPQLVGKYNVIVLAGLGQANADMTLPAKLAQVHTTLRQYLEVGGGLLVFASFGQMATDKPPQDAFLQPLGLTPLLDEMPLDPDTGTVATSWNIPFAYADHLTVSPVTAGMTGLWYPVPSYRIGAQNHTIPFVADNSWTVVVCGGKGSQTKKGQLQQNSPTDPGTYQSDVPLVAVKQVGKGRIVYLGITHEYLTGGNAMSTLEGIVLERGLKGQPSGGYTLLENCLRWLAEPSLASGAFGGGTMATNMLVNPQKTVFGAPYKWTDKVTFPAVEPAYPGVIGARTAYSSGKGTVDEWVAQAKAQGLAYLVFLEEFRQLSAEHFDKLKADCARLSTPDFSAIPGFTIDDEVGNHYFYFGTTFPYPDRKFLSEDGTVFRARDPEIDAKNPYVPGQLAMTALDYAYSISSFKLTAGNYRYHDAAPFADFFSDWDAAAVITSDNGKVVENAAQDYLKLVGSGQGPLPLALDLMDDPARLGQAKWRTVLRFPREGGSLIGGGDIEQATKIRDYFDTWHFYPDNPAKIYVTSGPEIESWAYVGPRDYGGDNDGNFVWQDYRWQLHGKVSSAVGLQEVTVYDGVKLFRRYLPGGKNDFEFTLDLTHDRQHNLALVVNDTQGNTAVGGEQWDRNHRLEEVQCADRNNQLSYGYSSDKDGIGTVLGGNQTLATPIKRVATHISPSGTFKNDALLGAPAFDGGAGGEPELLETVSARGVTPPVPTPNVSESHRLLHTGDVNIGDGVREHYFTDKIGVHNVWHTLWKTAPAEAYHVTRRNHFFQTNPDSPLAVFLWQIDITLLKDLPNQGFDVGLLTSHADRLWAFRGNDGTALAGTWEETERSASRWVNQPFGPGAYAAFLDSPLGGAAVFPLTDGQAVSFHLPKHDNLRIWLPPANAPQKQGETKRISLLILGIPRLTDATKQLPAASTEVVERFYHDFGLDGGKTGYTVQSAVGTVTGQRYLLEIDGAREQCFSGVLTGKLISSLPITVSGLHDHWSAYLYDRALKKARPLGMFEGKAWATVSLTGRQELFIGHPITADDAAIMLQLTQSNEHAWSLEAHNPTDQPITTTLRKNLLFDPLQTSPFSEEKVTIPTGSSINRTL